MILFNKSNDNTLQTNLLAPFLATHTNNKYVKIKTIALINKKDIFKFRYILPNKYIIIIIGIINNVVMHKSRANK